MNNCYSQSTCFDLALLGCESYHNNIINNIWNKRNYIIEREKEIKSSVKYELFDNVGYNILGAKTGGGDGYHVMIAVTEINNKIICGVIYGTYTSDDRFYAMIELFDVLSNKKNNVIKARKAIALDIETKEVLYNKDGYSSIVPMSTTKLLTILTASNYINIHKNVTVINDDLDEELCIVSSCMFKSGDTVTVKDLIYASLLPSSNQSANIIARIAGEQIINNV